MPPGLFPRRAGLFPTVPTRLPRHRAGRGAGRMSPVTDSLPYRVHLSRWLTVRSSAFTLLLIGAGWIRCAPCPGRMSPCGAGCCCRRVVNEPGSSTTRNSGEGATALLCSKACGDCESPLRRPRKLLKVIPSKQRGAPAGSRVGGCPARAVARGEPAAIWQGQVVVPIAILGSVSASAMQGREHKYDQAQRLWPQAFTGANHAESFCEGGREVRCCPHPMGVDRHRPDRRDLGRAGRIRPPRLT